MLSDNFFKRLAYTFLAPDLLQRETYEAFRNLLDCDRRCHEFIADLQELCNKKEPVDWTRVTGLCKKLSASVREMTNELAIISGRSSGELAQYHKKFDSYIRTLLQIGSIESCPPYVLGLEDDRSLPRLVGNKAAALCVLKRELGSLIPDGFVVTINSWHSLLEYNDLRPAIDNHLLSIDTADAESIFQASTKIMLLIESASVPPEVTKEITEACKLFSAVADDTAIPRFAVRSSGIHEDAAHTFAGQYETILNTAPKDIIKSYLKVLASKYAPNSILYRVSTGISDSEAPMAVLVMKMIDSKAAGVMYTEDPSDEKSDELLIYSVEGGGEKLVSGLAQSDTIRISKKEKVVVGSSLQAHDALGTESVSALADIAHRIENLFEYPQDIEWAIDNTGPVILQSRPLHKDDPKEKTNSNGGEQKELPLLYQGGLTASRGRACGRVWHCEKNNQPGRMPPGAVLIVNDIPASHISYLPHCAGVIAMQGSVACHFATICREFGVPLLVAASGVSESIKQGEQVTLDADLCAVFRGKSTDNPAGGDSRRGKNDLPYHRRLRLLLDFIAPLNLLDPDGASFRPEFCRSLHDIVRYAHETGVQAMFGIGRHGSRRKARKRLLSALPFKLYLIDVESERPKKQQRFDDTIAIDDVVSSPFQALWKGLSDSSIEWGDREYYNWKEYDNAAMTDGFAFKNDADSASYALYSNDYLNINIRFGYHFTIVDTFCGQSSEQNYCAIRFSGGGGTEVGRHYRLLFIETILSRMGFKVEKKTDLLDARLDTLSKTQLERRLVTLGRMLGESKLMDMILSDDASVEMHLRRFFEHDDTIN